LRADPQAREAVRKALEDRIKGLSEAPAESVAAEVAEKTQRLTELQKRAADLTEQLSAIQAELSTLQSELMPLQEQLSQTPKADESIAVLQQSLELIKTLDQPETVEAAPAAPAEVAATPAVATAPVRYNRDIRPILSNKCFACHGPDRLTRKGGLRLDDGKVAFEKLASGAIALSPGDREASTPWHRITTTDKELQMPPADFEKQLTAE